MPCGPTIPSSKPPEPSSGAGFDDVTIAAVATHSEVSRQTVYSLFGSQANLVTDLLDTATTALELAAGVGVHVGWSVLLETSEA